MAKRATDGGIGFHPLADIFPLMEGAEFDELAADIKRNGLHEPVVVFEGMILDGRNRYRACEAADIEPTFTVYTGDDPLAYVVSMNLKRRHLKEGQRAMVAAKLATMKRGDNQHSPIGETSQADAATLLNVGKRSVERAREVIDHGAPELVQAVERGDVSVSAAAEVASLPEPEQREALASGDKAVKGRAKEIRDAYAKRSAAAKKGAEKAAETRRRKNAEKAEAREREMEETDREMKELASKLIQLDRDVALAVHQVVSSYGYRGRSFEYALEEGLGLIEEIPDDEQDDTSDDTIITDTTGTERAA